MFANIRNAFSERFDQNRSSRQRVNNRSVPPSTQTHRHQSQEPPAMTQRAPPASTKAIKQLPTIRVTPEDLVDPSNRECCVCLDENRLDDKVTRLPCAHIFHTCCIIDWLSNHSCTCPVCRYELPTDDPQYESGRIQRMKLRKPRYAMHELKRMRISGLLDLKRRPLSGVVEKTDLIQALIDNDWIDIIPAPEPVHYKLEVLRNMKIGDLKRTMAEAGVFFRREDVLMKSDMISLFENSGRLVLIRSHSDDESTIALDYFETKVNETMDKEQPNSMELSSTSNIEMGSTMDFQEDQVLVETVTNDSLDPEVEVDLNEAPEEEIVGPTIEMFPNQNEEFIEESKQNETSDNLPSFVSVTPMIPNTQRASSLFNRTEDFVSDRTSALSNTQNPMLTEILPQADAVTENVVVGEEFLDSDENRYDSASASDIRSDAQALGQMDIDDENLSAIIDLIRTDMDIRSTFQHYTIQNLQTLGRDLQIDLSYCLEREEMIDIFINKGITGNADPSVLSPLMFSSWSVSQLRVVASEIKISLSECTTKDDMIKSILHAGNIERPFLREYLRSLSPLTTKSLPGLRAIARELQINIADCLEKDEIIRRLMTRNQRVEVN